MSETPAESTVASGKRSLIRLATRRLFGHACRTISVSIWCLVCCGLFCRVTILDRSYPWALIYYMTPIASLPLWVALAAISGWLSRRLLARMNQASKRIYFVRWQLAIGMTFVVWTFFAECVRRDQPVPSEHLRLVFWNVARTRAGVDHLAAELKSLEAEIIGLVESNPHHANLIRLWQQELSEYEIVETDFSGLLAVKGQVTSHRLIPLGTRSNCEQFDVRAGGRDFTVLLVDIASDLWRSRRTPLERLAQLADELDDRPVVIMGDFNTPDDSLWFAPLKSHHHNVFRERGSGFAPSWPMILPVLTLDQMWVNRRVNVWRCLHGWTVRSDHRPVISDVTFGTTE